tara:strand:- start:1881 stop:2363 length:483 start_codon:yes stop_codon:yes gene_type:complete
MSKVSTEHLKTCIAKVLEGSQEKKREFMETVELQIGLKNYDPQKDKRFAGTIKLPHIPRPKLRICILGDAFHCEKAAGLGLDFKNADGLKAFNKNKKLIKKFGARRPHSCPSSLRQVWLCVLLLLRGGGGRGGSRRLAWLVVQRAAVCCVASPWPDRHSE